MKNKTGHEKMTKEQIEFIEKKWKKMIQEKLKKLEKKEKA